MSSTMAWLDTTVRAWNSRLARAVTLWAARRLLEHRTWLLRLVSESRLWNFLLSPSTCCSPGSCHARFVQHFYDLLQGSRALEYLRAYLGEQDPKVLAPRLETAARVLLLGMLRHHVLACEHEHHGTPPTVLMDAQLAPYPDCNLDCFGCYTREDRAGVAPDRAHLAWLVDEAAACGAWAVHIAGKGEPFLSGSRADDLLAIVSARPHLMFTVATNGMAIPDALAERLARASNLLLLVSVEGPAAIHDARRGAGTFARVQRTLITLRRHGALFGFTCMVGRNNAGAVIDAGFVRAQAEAGCVLGVYSRYFPLSPVGWEELSLGPAGHAAFGVALAEARRVAAIPLLDLDDLEERTGCRSRAGVSVYIDGVTGDVAPCLRTPFAPPECRLDRRRGAGLAAVLAHPFFVRYRAGGAGRRTWCGADLAGELGALAVELNACGACPERLAGYRRRAAGAFPGREAEALARAVKATEVETTV